MNKSFLCGRLTRDPEVKQANGSNGPFSIAKFTLAVDRRGKDAGADFINCTTMGKQAEFVEKYITKGTKIIVVGHIQTGSYTNKDGNKVYTTDVFCDEIEFAESKNNSGSQAKDNSFVNSDVDADLPFN